MDEIVNFFEDDSHCDWTVEELLIGMTSGPFI